MRNIQTSHIRNPGVRAFLAPLMAAVFWVVIALKFPVERIPDWVPALAPYARWVTPLFLLLALWAFLRSGRNLVRIANSRHAQAPHGGGLPGKRPQGQAGSKSVGSKSVGSKSVGPKSVGPKSVGARAAPTVQRMR